MWDCEHLLGSESQRRTCWNCWGTYYCGNSHSSTTPPLDELFVGDSPTWCGHIGSNEEVVELGNGVDGLGLYDCGQLGWKYHGASHCESRSIRMSRRNGYAESIDHICGSVELGSKCCRVAMAGNSNRGQSRSWDVDWDSIGGASTHESINVAIQIRLGNHASRVGTRDVEDGNVFRVVV